MNSFALTDQADHNVDTDIVCNFISDETVLNQFQCLISASVIITRTVMIELQNLILNSFL